MALITSIGHSGVTPGISLTSALRGMSLVRLPAQAAHASHDRLGEPPRPCRPGRTTNNGKEARLDTAADKTLQRIAIALARAFLAGDADAVAMAQRGGRALGRTWPWLRHLAREVHRDFGSPWPENIHDELARYIAAFKPLRHALAQPAERPTVRGYFTHHTVMGPPAVPGATVPRLDTPGDLAAWLGLTPTQLEWLADPDGWRGKAAPDRLSHYRHRWLAKASGGFRLIEAPRPRLKAIQRRILTEILDRVPCHEAAQGCVPGGSALANARRHAGRPLVLRLDLADFFTSIPASRIHALFATLGYPDATCRYLTGLTTRCTPPAVPRTMPLAPEAPPEVRCAAREQGRRLMARHLPQGAPTSPALANLCAYRLDLRLTGAAGSSRARYSRYVDDLVFSCDHSRRDRAHRLAAMAYTIILEEGYAPNFRKTRLQGRAQSQRVTGLVVNAHPNLPRRERDRLKAILNNCARLGPESQNRLGHPDFRAHLLGRVAHLAQVNPAQGAKFMALFEAIPWPPAPSAPAGRPAEDV